MQGERLFRIFGTMDGVNGKTGYPRRTADSLRKGLLKVEGGCDDTSRSNNEGVLK